MEHARSMEIGDRWLEIALSLQTGEAVKSVYVVGESSTGKTTFSRFLYEFLCDDFPTAYIDCDPGQSIIGPPGTLGARLVARAAEKQEKTFLRFIGSTTPSGNLLQILTGVRRLLDKVIEEKAQRVIIDSSGFVSGPQAIELQLSIIDIVQPDVLVAFKKGQWISRLTFNFRYRENLSIYELPVSTSVLERTTTERRNYRRKRFGEYFSNAGESMVSLGGIGFYGSIPDLRRPERYCNLLCALCDDKQFVITLGIARKIDIEKKTLILFSPPFNLSRVASLHFGSIYLKPNGEELQFSRL